MHVHVPDEVRSEPPSVKLVWYSLRHEGDVSQKQLRKAWDLDRDTVRSALERLEEMGYAEPIGRELTDLRTRRWRYRDG